MSESKFTKGPWKYHDSGAIVMTDDGQMSVTDIRGFGRLQKDSGTSEALKIMDANGRLIAAAPELFEACQAALGNMKHFCDASQMDMEVRQKLELAIQKATGE